MLFENPGVPDTTPSSGVTFEQEREPWWGEVRSRIVEFLGAPNMINTRHRHVASRIYRVKKHHCLEVNTAHVVKCLLGSASLALNLVAFGVWAWARIANFVHWRGVSSDSNLWLRQLAQYEHLVASKEDALSNRQYVQWLIREGRLQYWLRRNSGTFLHKARPVVDMIDAYYVAHNGMKRTRTLYSLGSVVRASFGLSDEASWTLLQHSMLGLWLSFEPGADLPRPNSYQIVRKWPRGVGGAAQNIVLTCLRGMVPFHPAAPGLHTLRAPNRLAEARVCRIPGYIYEEPWPLPFWSPLRRLSHSTQRLDRFCRWQLARARQAGTQKVTSLRADSGRAWGSLCRTFRRTQRSGFAVR